MAFALEKVREIAERVAQSMGLTVWDLELKGSGATRTLRIYIDRPQGVTHEDCAAYSREVATIFDVEDAVPGAAYVLEISSPGLDRKLFKPEHFARFTGSLVKFSTRDLVNGNRHFEGPVNQLFRRSIDSGSRSGGESQKGQGAGSRGGCGAFLECREG